ncbi:MAG: flagellar export chaperone FliS [Gemmatirosa sp.]|nr:flagellar export chaperone FliS [Gemmatirosa sp.]
MSTPRAAMPGQRGPAVAASPYAAQAARYRDAELASASPGQLVVMLFDKMLLTLRRAKVACEARQIEERCEQILKVTDMVTELRLSLDHAQGGAISAQLDALYAFMLRELFEANRRQDAAKIEVVLRIAGELREAFAGANASLAAGAAAAPLAARSA